MTLRWRQLRDEARQRLLAAEVEDPDQELRWMIERASGRSAAEQTAALDLPATTREVAQLDSMLTRRSAGEPLQYVVGSWGFRTLDLLVDQRVLIPRPETEMVAGLAIEVARRRGEGCVAVDLGTGSGAIALSLAAECWPAIEVWATDASEDALAVARANLAALGRRAAAVRLAAGDWFEALPPELANAIDLVVSNPPYVPDGTTLPREVAHWEPGSALFAGPDGMDAIRRIVGDVAQWLRPGGTLVVEIGDEQGPAAVALAQDAGLEDPRLERDLAGRDRALVASTRS